MLDTEEGSMDINGLDDADTVGSKRPIKDGPFDADGISLSFVVGGILTLDPMLGVDTGYNDLDGWNEELLDVGGAIALSDGRIDTSRPMVGLCDDGVAALTDGSVLTWDFQFVNARLMALNSHSGDMFQPQM
eukprot:scaffold29810_cov71-Attheya_sp.AAC.2